MRITFVTRKFGNVERNSHCDVLHLTPIRVANLVLDCNGTFAIKAYCVLFASLNWELVMQYSFIETNTVRNSTTCSVVSFTQLSPTCGHMSLPAQSLWPGRQPYRPRLVGGRRGVGHRLWLPKLEISDWVSSR